MPSGDFPIAGEIRYHERCIWIWTNRPDRRFGETPVSEAL
ncbi:hypothetical protein K788_0007898 (plasmid) [Paraburkholderia caribensis MBA4]|uniref:Uncharacterized protein n=1 Tax=Paraburkholderia caribensis MBA4 TaxID=1323664 RepID=A0A0P0RL57_9BURK|nr:hypothetical protein K788_0007898 [Paraburkholderia caribensis MBA4]